MFFVLGLLANLFLLTSHQIASANDVGPFFIWRLTKDSPRMLLPRNPGQNPFETAQNYIRKFNDSLIYQSLTFRTKLPSDEVFLESTDHNSRERKPRVALIANRLGQMTPRDPLLIPLINALESRDLDPIVIPLGWELLLSERQRDQFKQDLAEQFPALVALGGFSLHPQLVRSLDHIIDLSLDVADYPSYYRDALEIELIESYTNTRQGFFFGICRGHQIWGVINGHTIQVHKPGFYSQPYLSILAPHDPVPDPIQISRITAAFISEASNINTNVLKESLGGLIAGFPVTVRHNQSIALRHPENSRFRIIAVDAEGTIEAVQSDDQRILTVQFHIEDERTASDRAILNWISNRIKGIERERCVSNLERPGE